MLPSGAPPPPPPPARSPLARLLQTLSVGVDKAAKLLEAQARQIAALRDRVEELEGRVDKLEELEDREEREDDGGKQA